MNMPDYEQIASHFAAFRANPGNATRNGLKSVISPFASDNEFIGLTEYTEAADYVMGVLNNPFSTVAQVHAALIHAAGLVGFDPATLGGGQTPED